MKPKNRHFPTLSRASARTARWPWCLFGFWQAMLRQLIIRLFHIVPIPTAQNTVPARKPSRVFVLRTLLATPRHHRRSVTNVLMQANVVVEMRKFVHRLLQLRFACDFNLPNGALEGAKEAFNAAILPWRMRLTSLMLDACQGFTIRLTTQRA
jgi:hypothetical protein